MMWFIIGVIGIIVLVFWINSYQNKYQSFQGNVFNIIVMGLIIFVIISSGYVYLNGDFTIKSFNDFSIFARTYFSWLASFFTNAKGVAGYVINQNWVGNITNVTKSKA
ncbi:hypothetical protein J4408_01075 [Candidatus Pacearchaeota archaeon]|nr:hypothetical protein [Candidatus Pacearchaeota archaeon]